MSLVNSIFGWFIKKRIHDIELFQKYPHEVQREVLMSLVHSAKNTEWGRKYSYEKIESYQQFAKNVPIQDYESLQPWIERMIKGEQNLLWEGEIKWFAKSSGTTSSKSKFIPVSKESLENCHFKAGKDMLSIYYNHFPESKLFAGKSLVVGGSNQINELSPNSFYGDLSAVIIKNLPIWAEFRRVPEMKIALMAEWEEKLDKMARSTYKDDVTNISGVPSWTLILMRKILEITGETKIDKVWPNLELYMHGGVSFSPYRDQYKSLFSNPDKMTFLETYNASEGFFSIQDTFTPKSYNNGMLLMLDYGIYYEFIPQCEPDRIIPLEHVQIGVNYAMVISTNGGLWRYKIGDTIEFTCTDPYRIKVTGRTKHFINVFGEELIIDNVEKALGTACKKAFASVREYTGAPIYMESTEKGGHEWVIEFEKKPENPDFFMETFDTALKSLNSDYEAKRHKNMILDFPKLIVAPKGLFYEWMKSRGKIGGQNKVPRLSNNREYIDVIKTMISKEYHV